MEHNGFIREMQHHFKVWKEHIAKLNEVTSGTRRDTAVPVSVKITFYLKDVFILIRLIRMI